MENKIYLSETKVLEHNEKSFNDTTQLFKGLDESRIEKDIELANEDEKFKEALSSLSFDKGRTIWLELKVEDSYLSSMLQKWMFSKSSHDGGSGLHAMGCSLNSIMFSKPSGYSDDEKYAIKTLYDAAFENNA